MNTKFRKFWRFVLKILSKILTSIKGRISAVNLRKTMIYNTIVDLVNDVHTKFGLNLSIRSQDIEQNGQGQPTLQFMIGPNSYVNQGP